MSSGYRCTGALLLLPLLLSLLSPSVAVGTNHYVRMPRTPLERSRTSEVYRRRLDTGWGAFMDFLRGAGLCQKITTARSMSHHLALFVQHSHDQGLPMWVARHAVLAAQTKHREWRGQLKRAWDALASWRQELPAGHRTPFTEDLVRALSAVAWHQSVQEPADAWRWLIWGFLLRIGFFGLLRPGELSALLVSHILITTASSLVVTIVSPKTRKIFGRQQFAVISDLATVNWARWLLQSLPSSTALWNFPTARLRTMMIWALQRLELSHLSLTPAGLRAGGATHLFIHGWSVDQLRFRGRWVSVRSLEAYIQEAMSLLVMSQLAPSEAVLVRQLVTAGAPLWEHPPAVPFSSLVTVPTCQRPRSGRRKKLPS